MKSFLEDYASVIEAFEEEGFLDYLQEEYPHLYNALVLAVLDRLPK